MPVGAVCLALCIHVMWGGNPVAVKWGLEVFPPMWSGFVRFAIGAMCVGLWALLRRERLWPAPTEWPALGLVAVLFMVQITTMNIGFGGTSGSLGALLIALNPLFAALFARYFVREDRLTAGKALGLVVAFAGTAVVLSPSAADGNLEFTRLANWILLLSAVLLGARLMYSASVIRRIGETRVMFWMMLLSLPLFLVGGLTTETIEWANLGWRPVAGIAYQGIAIAGVAFMVNSYLMRHHAPSVVASFNFVSPVAGVALSIWLLNEVFTATLAAGLVMVALGLVLITRARVHRSDI